MADRLLIPRVAGRDQAQSPGHAPSAEEPPVTKKRPGRVGLPSQSKLLVGRDEAAEMLSISPRAIDYLISTRRLIARRIGTRVLIPTTDLERFARADHPERLAG